MDAVVDTRSLEKLKVKGRGRRLAGRILMLIGAVALLVGGVAFWLSGGRYVSTDDAYIAADKLMVSTAFGGTMEADLKNGVNPKHDPVPLAVLMAQATSRLGVVPTMSTSFYPPFLLARLCATIDHLARGRFGWGWSWGRSGKGCWRISWCSTGARWRIFVRYAMLHMS